MNEMKILYDTIKANFSSTFLLPETYYIRIQCIHYYTCTHKTRITKYHHKQKNNCFMSQTEKRSFLPVTLNT